MDNDQKNVESITENEEQQREGEHPIKNIVLVGRAGNGKSATGNSIARQNVFVSKMHAGGVTMECKTFRVVTPDGSILNVIDTPGLCDMTVSADFISKEIVSCLNQAKGGIHAVLYVVSVKTRMTAEEETVLNSLQVLFGSKILDYFIVVFTGGDELEQDGITLDDYLGNNLPEFLMRMLILSGKRMIVFDNRTKDAAKHEKQVHDLLALVDLVGKQNNNIPYTDDMYNKIKEETDRHNKEQEELQAKGHATEQLEAMKKELQLNYEMNLKAMSESMAQTLKAAAEAQRQSYEAKVDMVKSTADMERQMREERQNQLERQMREDRQMHEEKYEEMVKSMAEMERQMGEERQNQLESQMRKDRQMHKEKCEEMAQTLKAAAEAQKQNYEDKVDVVKSMAEMERQMHEERQNQLERQIREDRQMHEERKNQFELQMREERQMRAEKANRFPMPNCTFM